MIPSRKSIIGLAALFGTVSFGVQRTLERLHYVDSLGLWYTVYCATAYTTVLLVLSAVVWSFAFAVSAKSRNRSKQPFRGILAGWRAAFHTGRGYGDFYFGRYEQAVRELELASQLDPGNGEIDKYLLEARRRSAPPS